MKKFAIIVAGGSGSRMGGEIPKQFLEIKGKPILFHTIEKFLQIPDIQIIIVLPEKDIQLFESLEKQNSLIQYQLRHSFNHSLIKVIGGKTRFQSVKNGLSKIEGDGLLAVHDGVRPLVSVEIIKNSFEIASEKGSAVACVPLKDSARIILEDGSNQTIDRSKLRLMQTPQTFRLNIFRQAFQIEEQSFFTDCASVVEYAGFSVNLINGGYENIKITTPEDLIFAENFI